MACCHPKLVSCLSWIPTPLLRACFVGTTCKLHDVSHKCLGAVTGDNITSQCLQGWSQLSLAGGSRWQWELKEEMIKSSSSIGSLTVLTWKFTLASNSEVYLAMTHKPILLLKLEAGAWTLVLQEHKVFDQDQIMFVNVKVHSSSCCHFIFHRQWVKLLSQPGTDTGS